jgi:hypothetical protein
MFVVRERLPAEYFPASVYEADAEILNIINDDDFS